MRVFIRTEPATKEWMVWKYRYNDDGTFQFQTIGGIERGEWLNSNVNLDAFIRKHLESGRYEEVYNDEPPPSITFKSGNLICEIPFKNLGKAIQLLKKEGLCK